MVSECIQRNQDFLDALSDDLSVEEEAVAAVNVLNQVCKTGSTENHVLCEDWNGVLLVLL